MGHSSKKQSSSSGHGGKSSHPSSSSHRSSRHPDYMTEATAAAERKRFYFTFAAIGGPHYEWMPSERHLQELRNMRYDENGSERLSTVWPIFKDLYDHLQRGDYDVVMSSDKLLLIEHSLPKMRDYDIERSGHGKAIRAALQFRDEISTQQSDLAWQLNIDLKYLVNYSGTATRKEHNVWESEDLQLSSAPLEPVRIRTAPNAGWVSKTGTWYIPLPGSAWEAEVKRMREKEREEDKQEAEREAAKKEAPEATLSNAKKEALEGTLSVCQPQESESSYDTQSESDADRLVEDQQPGPTDWYDAPVERESWQPDEELTRHTAKGKGHAYILPEDQESNSAYWHDDRVKQGSADWHADGIKREAELGVWGDGRVKRIKREPTDDDDSHIGSERGPSSSGWNDAPAESDYRDWGGQSIERQYWQPDESGSDYDRKGKGRADTLPEDEKPGPLDHDDGPIKPEPGYGLKEEFAGRDEVPVAYQSSYWDPDVAIPAQPAPSGWDNVALPPDPTRWEGDVDYDIFENFNYYDLKSP